MVKCITFDTVRADSLVKIYFVLHSVSTAAQAVTLSNKTPNKKNEKLNEMVRHSPELVAKCLLIRLAYESLLSPGNL